MNRGLDLEEGEGEESYACRDSQTFVCRVCRSLSTPMFATSTPRHKFTPGMTHSKSDDPAFHAQPHRGRIDLGPAFDASSIPLPDRDLTQTPLKRPNNFHQVSGGSSRDPVFSDVARKNGEARGKLNDPGQALDSLDDMEPSTRDMSNGNGYFDPGPESQYFSDCTGIANNFRSSWNKKPRFHGTASSPRRPGRAACPNVFFQNSGILSTLTASNQPTPGSQANRNSDSGYGTPSASRRHQPFTSSSAADAAYLSGHRQKLQDHIAALSQVPPENPSHTVHPEPSAGVIATGQEESGLMQTSTEQEQTSFKQPTPPPVMPGPPVTQGHPDSNEGSSYHRSFQVGFLFYEVLNRCTLRTSSLIFFVVVINPSP
jgi:hypothetical protein